MDPAAPGDGGREGFFSPIAQMMDEDRRHMPPEQIPQARKLPPVPIGKARFRTSAEAARKRFHIPLLIPHVGKDDPGYPDAHRRYKNWAIRQRDSGRIAKDEFQNTTMLLKRDLAVFAVIHDYKIQFQPIRRSRECVYTTDSPIVADYIRWRMGLGDFDFLSEDLRPLMIRIGDKEFPASMIDPEGQRELAKLMASGVDLSGLVLTGASDGVQ